MDRRRTAGLLLALAACIATATAAPTASNHTALDLYEGAPDGCYYNFQHYGEGDRIMTNEPCLNCTCHNRMLMCYLRVCPFTKPIGQDCTIEKRADQCCPIVTCPDVPVDLLTSTTTSPAEYGSTGMGKLDKFGCSINGKYFSEGSKVPPTPNKPCEHCYCIRNMTTCVMQECTLHVDGCTPIYHKDVCCPVRYSCDHPEDEMPLLDDLSTTVRPTPGFLLTTTTVSPVTQMSQDCVYDNRVFPDGALIKTEKACDHCYCMKGDIVCVVQECGTPMENEGKNCTALPPREGVCCPDTYICEGDEPTTGTSETQDFSTHAAHLEPSTLSPPRRTSSEGSGYRNEPDEIPYSEPDLEGSGEEEDLKQPLVTSQSPMLGLTDDILASTEETHEFIPLTTTKPEDKSITTTVGADKDDGKVTNDDDIKNVSENQETLLSTTIAYSKKEDDESVTDKTDSVTDIGSGEVPEDDSYKPQTPSQSITEENILTTETNEVNIVTSKATDGKINEIETTTSSLMNEEIYTNEPTKQTIISTEDKTTSKLPSEQDISNIFIDTTTTAELTEQSQLPIEITTKSSESFTSTATSIPVVDDDDKQIDEIKPELKPGYYPSSTIVPSIDDEFVTTEIQEHDLSTEYEKTTEKIEPQQHITASTPMLEEIEKDTTEYNEPEHIVPNDETFNVLSTTSSSIVPIEMDKVNVTKEQVTEDNMPQTTDIPIFDQQSLITTQPSTEEVPIDSSIKETSEPELLASSTSTPDVDESGRRTVQPDLEISKDQDTTVSDISSSSTEEREQATTEPDKGLNTIPSDLLDKEVAEPPVTHQITVTDEENITESDHKTTLSTEYDSKTSPSIQTTILPDTSVSREDQTKSTTESAFRKEDYSPTESQDSFGSTTVAEGVTEDVIYTVAHADHTEYEKATEPSLDIKDIATTLQPKDTKDEKVTTLAQDGEDVTRYEFTTLKVSSEKDDATTEETTTLASSFDATTKTTTANQEDNEIFSEPRIPGEGDCLLNGVRYINESAVPNTNKCQSDCKCISSIIKCDPILCSPPPEYMNNCETMYDSPDACCPTYICDHKTETKPPQSHSQMSGTEAPTISPASCQGEECVLNIDKKEHEEPSDACKSGNCSGQTDVFQDTSDVPSEVTEKPITEYKEECTGDKCTPVICTKENGCQAQVKPCEGEKCEVPSDSITAHEPKPCVDGKDCTMPIEPEIQSVPTAPSDSITAHEPQHCVDGKECTVPISPTEQCSSGNCDTTDIQPEGQTVPTAQPGPISAQEPQQCEDGKDCTVPIRPTEQCSSGNCDTTDIQPEGQTVPTTQPGPISAQEPQQCEDGKDCTVPIRPTEQCSSGNCDTADIQPEGQTVPTTQPGPISAQEPQQCEDGKDCTVPIRPIEQCSLGNCTASDIQAEGQTVPTTPGEECKDESCKKIDESHLDESIPQNCSEPGCKQIQGNVDVPIIPMQEKETTEKVESHTDSLQHFTTQQPEVNEILITHTEVIPDNYLTTLSDKNGEVTKSEFESVTSTELFDSGTTENTITAEHLPDETLHPTRPESTESFIEVEGTKVTSSDETTTDMTYISTIPEDAVNVDDHAIKTERPQDTETTEPVEIHHDLLHSTEEPTAFTPERVKEPDYLDKHDSEEVTQDALGESFTMQPMKENVFTIKETTDEVSTKRVEYQETTKLSDITELGQTTTKYLEESSSKTPLVTESQEGSSSPVKISDEDITKKTTDATTIEIDVTKSSNDFIKESVTEPSTPFDIEHSHEMDHTKTVQHTTTDIPAVFMDSQMTTETTGDKELDSFTEKIVEEVSEVTKSTSTESQESTKSPIDKEFEHIPSIVAEATITESPKTSVAEPKETSKHFADHEVTTANILDKPSSDPQDHTVEPYDQVTHLHQDDVTKILTDESGLTASQDDYTKSQVVTKSPEYIEHKETTITSSQRTSTESLGTSVTDRYEPTSTISEEFTTETSMTHSTEDKDTTISSEKVDYVKTTAKASEESFTEQPTTSVPKSHETSESLEEVDQEKITLSILDEITTAPSKLPSTEKQETKLPEEIINEVTTTVNDVREATTLPSQDVSTGKDVGLITQEPDTELPYTTDGSNIPKEADTTTLKPFDDNVSEPAESSDRNKLEPTTAGQESFKPELTTAPSISTVEGGDEMMVGLPYDSESKPVTIDVSAATEQGITTLVTTKQDVTTIVPDLSDNEKKHDESKLEQPLQTQTAKPDFETQTALTPTTSQEDYSHTDLLEPHSTQQPDELITSEKDPSTSDIQVPSYEPVDEHRTTTSEIQDSTTLKPSEEYHDLDKITEYPEISSTSYKEQSTESLPAISQKVPTTEIHEEDVKPVNVEDELNTEKPSAATNIDSTKIADSEQDTIQTTPASKPLTEDENIPDDTTKSNLYEDLHTVEPYHEAKEPEKHVDVQSLVTEQYQTSTQSSDRENDYQTSPKSDVTQSIEQGKLTVPPNEFSVIVTSEPGDKLEYTTPKDYSKPADGIVSTEPQTSIVETTSEKESLPEEGSIAQEPSKPEQNELPEHTLTTKRPDVTTSFTVSGNETTGLDAMFTEKQELASTDKYLVDEKTGTEATNIAYEQTSVPNQDVTKTPEGDTQDVTEPSEVSSPEFLSTGKPTLASLDHHSISTDIPERGMEQPESATESTISFEPTTAPKHEHPESEDKQFTTESTNLPLSPEIHTEKQPETTQIVTTENEILSAEHLTTRKQLEPEIYQTTSSAIEDIPEKSTHHPVLHVEGSTILDHDIVLSTLPEDRQSTPNIIEETENIFTSKEPIAVQTEKIPSASGKPMQETTAPEEEFVFATPKYTTTRAEEEISTLSLASDKTLKPTDKPEDLPLTTIFAEPTTLVPEIPNVTVPETPLTIGLEEAIATASEEPIMHGEPITNVPSEQITISPSASLPESPSTNRLDEAITSAPEAPIESTEHDLLMTKAPEETITTASETPAVIVPEEPITNASEELITDAPETSVITVSPERTATVLPEATTVPEVMTVPEAPISSASEASVSEMPETPTTKPSKPPVTAVQDTKAPEPPITKAPEASITKTPESPVTLTPEIPKPVSTQPHPTDELPPPEEEGSFPPSGGTSGYGQEPDYMEEDQTFGPGTCRYGGKVYVSAQQIPRDDPCDFCFCFRSDIICLQQSCPPPIHGCHEEPIQGFCCPRYECPVSMATTVNVTTTTTTTTTTLPPHFPTHSYKGSVNKQGCQIKGITYKVGDVVRASSGPCLHCTCGGDGQMKCDPKVCTPEPMLRQMIAAAVSAKRRR